MNGFTVQWSESVRHIGIFVDSTLSDSLDCRYKRSMFIGYVNKLISKFGHLQPHILLNLFKTYCCFFFGASTWRLNSAGFKSCTTAWNVGHCRATQTFEFAEYYTYMVVRAFA